MGIDKLFVAYCDNCDKEGSLEHTELRAMRGFQWKDQSLICDECLARIKEWDEEEGQ